MEVLDIFYYVLVFGFGMEVLLKIVFVYSGESGIFGFIEFYWDLS